MTDFENELRGALREPPKAAQGVPAFADVFAAAEARVAARKRRQRAIGGFAAAAAVALVALTTMRPAEQPWQYIDPEEIAGSTNWVAPSDVLLPERRFDIYGEIPVLIESTESDEGALL